MKWSGWERVPLEIPGTGPETGIRASAIAPLIVSASRSTDIPAFYGDWFMNRLRAGYVKWKSPFGGNPVYVSFAKTRVFAFWSKNPAPFLPCLDALDRMRCGYYFLYTLNDYDTENLEPQVPAVDTRIRTFIRLAERIGKGRVVWRFDPLLLSDRVSVGGLLDRVKRVGDRISPYTRRMVFSFIDIGKYRRVQHNLKGQGFSGVREFSDAEREEFCTGLADLNRAWGLRISACGENGDLERYGIEKGQCISYSLMTEEFSDDRVLMEFLRPGGQQVLGGSADASAHARRLKDPGQRNTCSCIVSKDIGQYSTCMHLCAYCYANTSISGVAANYQKYREDTERGIFHDSITG
jgi:DNA repair photolyase